MQHRLLENSPLSARCFSRSFFTDPGSASYRTLWIGSCCPSKVVVRVWRSSICACGQRQEQPSCCWGSCLFLSTPACDFSVCLQIMSKILICITLQIHCIYQEPDLCQAEPFLWWIHTGVLYCSNPPQTTTYLFCIPLRLLFVFPLSP